MHITKIVTAMVRFEALMVSLNYAVEVLSDRRWMQRTAQIIKFENKSLLVPIP
jgi:hypothetical protein